MFFIYQVINYLIILFSPIIIFYRILKKKEHPKRFLEKFSIFSKENNAKNLIWFHGSSVGEILSIIPLIEKLEKNKNINKILITSQTLSSSYVIEKYKLKKTFHQFYPLDLNIFSEKFLNHWNPKLAIFVESEVWPSMFNSIKKKYIPLLLINARITKKTFKKWMSIESFAKNIFQKIDISYPQNSETNIFLEKLNVKEIKFFGNIKFAESINEKKISLKKNFIKEFKKKRIWCAASTHGFEEEICAKIHLKLKKKYKNILTIIIPRHIHRAKKIKQDLDEIGLNVQFHSSGKNLEKNTDIYLVDTYGETKKFYKISKTVFLGGSLVNHGGQNPIEAARFGSDIIHGPNISNFDEVYKLLKKMKISIQVNNISQFEKAINRKISLKINSKQHSKIEKMGRAILLKHAKEIDKVLENEF